MKAIAAITIVALALSGYFVHRNFKEDQNDFGKRLANIAAHVNSMNASWRAEQPERFISTTKAEAIAMMGTFLGGNENLPELDYTGINPPDSFDSREQWPNCESIKEIRDQSNCGSCWAFGAVEAMSDRYCIESGQKSQVKISAEDLLACCHGCGAGCNGGYPSAAWSYFKGSGLVTGDLYEDNKWCKPYSLAPCAHHTESTKYPKCQGSSKTPSCHKKCIDGYEKDYKADLHFGDHVHSIRGENNMMAEISTNGPIEVAFTVYEDFLTYKSGVYHHVSGSQLGGHAVKAIGYGVENGVKYWLVANSWNETWGDKGYFKIRRGKDDCGIERDGVAAKTHQK